MNDYSRLVQARTNRGFILITSLIFLVVITLLSVSAINSSTLQEHMASNLREKSRARQAADAALREAETRLASAAFNQLNAATGCGAGGGDGDSDSGASQTGAMSVCYEGSFVDPGDSDAFLEEQTWNHPAVQSYSADENIDADVKYIVEEIRDCTGPNLDPERCAVGTGVVRYRITAYAHGENPAAIAVTQSVYAKPY